MLPAIRSWPTMQDDQEPRSDHPAEGVNVPYPGIQTAHDMEEAEEHLPGTGRGLERQGLDAHREAWGRCGGEVPARKGLGPTAGGPFPDHPRPPWARTPRTGTRKAR